MLKSLIDGSTFSDFILIKDNENCLGLNIFNAFLANHSSNKLFTKINLICYENPPDCYCSKNMESVTHYNYFSDPLNWNNVSGPKTDLSEFTSNLQDHSESAFFIDSLSCLMTYHKFYNVYKNLTCLKKSGVKIIALIHSDLLALKEVEELGCLSKTIVELCDSVYIKGVEETTVTVTHKKPNGKVTKQTEIIFIDNDWKVSSKKKVEERGMKSDSDVKETIQSLATFKLGFDMSENEKRAKTELVLPYLKKQEGTGNGQIIYQPEADDFEEDPDDDLEI